MTAILAEFIGTALLLLLGDGVVANVVLKKTYGHNSGLIVIAVAWAMAVFVGVFVTAEISGAHLNPAVTLGLAAAGRFDWAQVPMYLAAQFLGAFVGAVLVWIHYKPHFDATENAGDKLGVFCTGPAIKNTPFNLISEIIGTFVLVYGAMHILAPRLSGMDGQAGKLGALDAIPVAFLVLVIGLSLGGTTGYAINPARDFSPRLAHALLPIKGKGKSNWGYAWIPVVGPVLGALLAALVDRFVG